MPEALQILWNLARDEKATGKLRTIKKIDSVLGLNLFKREKEKVPFEVKKIAEEREKLREKKEWEKSDELREKINNLGYAVEDTERGFVLKKMR